MRKTEVSPRIFRKRICLYAGAVLLLACLGLQLSIICQTAIAADRPTAGLTVSPAQLNLAVGQATPDQVAELTIVSSYDTEVRVAAELQAIDESGARLIPTGELKGDFADALHLSATDVTIPPHGRVTLRVALHNTSQLSAGGHYASLLLTQQSDSNAALAFRPAIAISIFAIKTDGLRTDLRLTGLTLRNRLFWLPESVQAAFDNGGNAHVVPRASVTIESAGSSGEVIGKAVVNTESLPLFPDQKSMYTAHIDYYHRPWLPSRLHVHAVYRLNGSDTQLVKDTSFWYVPPQDVVVVAATVVLATWQRKRLARLPRQLSRLIRGLFRRLSGRSKNLADRGISVEPQASTEAIGPLVLAAPGEPVKTDDSTRPTTEYVPAQDLDRTDETTDSIQPGQVVAVARQLLKQGPPSVPEVAEDTAVIPDDDTIGRDNFSEAGTAPDPSRDGRRISVIMEEPVEQPVKSRQPDVSAASGAKTSALETAMPHKPAKPAKSRKTATKSSRVKKPKKSKELLELPDFTKTADAVMPRRRK